MNNKKKLAEETVKKNKINVVEKVDNDRKLISCIDNIMQKHGWLLDKLGE